MKISDGYDDKSEATKIEHSEKKILYSHLACTQGSKNGATGFLKQAFLAS